MALICDSLDCLPSKFEKYHPARTIEHIHIFFLLRNLRIENFGPLGFSCDFVLQCT